MLYIHGMENGKQITKDMKTLNDVLIIEQFALDAAIAKAVKDFEAKTGVEVIDIDIKEEGIVSYIDSLDFLYE